MFTGRTAKIFGIGHSFERVDIPETVPLVERWETFIDHWYEDGIRKRDTPAGPKGSIIWSCCFGHAEDGDNEPKIMKPGQTFTIEEGRILLALDMKIKARYVDARVSVPITTFMRGALTSLVFQYGQGRFDEENLIPILNEGKYTKFARSLLKLSKTTAGVDLDGLALRRACEVAFFMTQIN